MLGEGGTPLEEVLAAIREYQARDVDPNEGEDELKLLRAIIDELQAYLAAHEAPEAVAAGGDNK
jgi:hypothetical protein